MRESVASSGGRKLSNDFLSVNSGLSVHNHHSLLACFHQGMMFGQFAGKAFYALAGASPASSLFPSFSSTTVLFRGMAGKALIKTNRSAAKRLRLRGSGSIKRNKAGRSHNTGYKSRSRVNRLAASTGIKGKGIEKRMRRLIGA